MPTLHNPVQSSRLLADGLAELTDRSYKAEILLNNQPNPIVERDVEIMRMRRSDMSVEQITTQLKDNYPGLTTQDVLRIVAERSD